MLLTKHVSVVVEIDRYVIDPALLNGEPPFKREVTPSPNYSDFSSVINWDKFGWETKVDYKAIRAEIKSHYASSTWSDFSVVEQETFSRWFVATPTERADIYTVAQQIQLGRVFHASSISARSERFMSSEIELYNRLLKVEVNEVIADLSDTAMLLRNYIEFGIEGTLEGDPEGLFDYIESRSGTSYAGVGLSSKTWVPLGYADMATLVAELMKLLKDGG